MVIMFAKGVTIVEKIYEISDYQVGYRQSVIAYHCLYCEFETIKGCVYPWEEAFYDSQKMMETHVAESHGGPLMALLKLPRELIGLSEAQEGILQAFAQQLSDKTIGQRLDISTSTVRNHRFKLKEKERQAKLFLSIMSLLNQSVELLPHVGAKQVDERYQMTEAERSKILATYLDEKGRIKSFPAREKRKLVLLAEIVEHFEPQKNYSESTLNEILKQYVDDFVTVRRYLIEYGFMKRKKDGSSYWRVML